MVHAARLYLKMISFFISYSKTNKLECLYLKRSRHERDLIFDLSCPIKMTGTGFFKNPVPGQSHLVQSKKYRSCLLIKNYRSMTGPDQW